MVTAVVTAAVVVGSPGTPAAYATGGVSCRLVQIAVSFAGSALPLRGTLCSPADRAATTVHLALAGATFDQAYWLVPARPGQPAYAPYMASRGYAVLALDRPGSGLSGRPPAAAVTLYSEVAVTHTVVGMLRSGAVDGVHYRTVVGIGHSFGSSVLIDDAAVNGDLDGVVATGFVHSLGPKLDALNAALTPASDDPLLRLTNPPAGYDTTLRGSRADLFFDPAEVDPGVLQLDELSKSTITSGEEATLAAGGDPAVSAAVGVPVLLGVGQNDDLFCNGGYLTCSDAPTVLAWESWFYGPAAALEAVVLPGAGHALNWHRNAPDLFAAISSWAARHGY